MSEYVIVVRMESENPWRPILTIDLDEEGAGLALPLLVCRRLRFCVLDCIFLVDFGLALILVSEISHSELIDVDVMILRGTSIVTGKQIGRAHV